MTKTNEHPPHVTDETKDRFQSDLETLKESFAKLRDDLSKLVDNTLGTGKSGAGMLKNRMGNLEDRGIESAEDFGQKIAEKPLTSIAIAVGIGFVLAKLLHNGR